MAARTGAKPRAGKGIIVASAVRNFTTLGYHGTTIRDIARGADVTVAAIYHHFPSKQEILKEIMVRTMKDTISLTRTALMRVDSSPEAQLTAVMHAWILFHTSRQQDALIGASELRSLEADGRGLVVALRDAQEAMFREIIERGVAEGVFRTEFPREAARAVINMGYAIATWYRAEGSISPTEMAERYCELALGTVRASVAGY